MSGMSWRRRELLRTLGLSGAMTFLPWLRPGRARAATVPKRLLLFWSGMGVPRHVYTFKSADGGEATETDFVFPAVREPLNAIRKDLITFENLDMVSAKVDRTRPSNAHYEGETHCLAATNRAGGDTPGGPSIDQYIAKAINGASPVTRIPSLAVAAQADGNVTSLKLCTTGPGQVVSLNPSPSSVYKRLFPQAATTSTATKPDVNVDDAAQRKSIVDLLNGEFAAAGKTLPADQAARLDAHASLVRDLERRMALVGAPVPTSVSAGVKGCQDPGAAVLKGIGTNAGNFDAMTRLVQAAFACDLTRVALLTVTEPNGGEWGYRSGSFGTVDAHDLSHKTSYNSAGILKNNADAMRTITALHQLEARQFVTMVNLLRQVPEADGKTLLDHTIVLWCSQIAEHGHDLDRLPWVIAGGSAAGFRPGRYLKYPRVNGRGAAHNDLFVSIAQGMGVQTDTFGNPAVCTGPLARLRS